MENSIRKYMTTISKTQPSYIATASSYERKCIYEAINKLLNDSKYKFTIKCHRVHKYTVDIANVDMCKKHRMPMTGACELCSDPFCCGPECPECYEDEVPNKYWALKGDSLYPHRTTIGLKLYYALPTENINSKYPNIKFMSLRNN